MDAQWTSQQVQALAAMNIPVWKKTPKPNHHYCYKMGAYYLVGESTSYLLNYLSGSETFNCVLVSDPVAVKAAESSDKCFNYDNWFEKAGQPRGKKRAVAQFKPCLK